MLKNDAILYFLLRPPPSQSNVNFLRHPPPPRILHGLYISFYCKHLHCDVGILWHPKDILNFSLVLFITHFQSVNNLPTLCIFFIWNEPPWEVCILYLRFWIVVTKPQHNISYHWVGPLHHQQTVNVSLKDCQKNIFWTQNKEKQQ